MFVVLVLAIACCEVSRVVFLVALGEFDKAINKLTSVIRYGSAGQAGIPRIDQLVRKLAVTLVGVT